MYLCHGGWGGLRACVNRPTDYHTFTYHHFQGFLIENAVRFAFTIAFHEIKAPCILGLSMIWR
jgi:hypothetical protein